MAKNYRPKPIAWRLQYASLRTLEFILRPIPLEVVSVLGSGLGMLTYSISRNYRLLVLRNLRIAFGDELSLEELRTLTRQSFRRTFSNFLGTLKTNIMPGQEVQQHVTFEGHELGKAAISEGNGVIMVLSHMGNWEIFNRLLHLLPQAFPAGAIYQPLKNPHIDTHIKNHRQRDGSTLFSKREGFHAPATFAKHGGMLVILADQRAGRVGMPIPFFNRLSSLSYLPILLSRKANNCPVIAVGIGTTKPGHWKMTFRPVENPNTSTIIQHLEGLIRQFPADYLWFHNRWKLSRTTPLTLNLRKAPSTPPPPTKPYQILLPSTSPLDTVAIQTFLSDRSPNDIPLAFHEFLYDSTDPPEAIAARINRFDLTLLTALQAALIHQPNPVIQRALKLSPVPQIFSNTKQLSFSHFLNELAGKN